MLTQYHPAQIATQPLAQTAANAESGYSVSSIAFLLFALISAMTASFSFLLDYENAKIFNIAINISVLLASLTVSLMLVAKDRVYLLSPIPWFYLACGAYYGFGPLSWYFANYTTVAYIDLASHNSIDDFGVFEANALCVYAITIVSFTLFVLNSFFRWEKRNVSDFIVTERSELLTSVFYIMAVFGIFVKYILVNFLFTAVFGIEIPSLFQQLQVFIKAAIIISYIILYRQKNNKVLFFRNFLILTELLTALLTTSKTEILFVAIAVLVGRVLGRKSMLATIGVGIAVVLFYVGFLSNYVLFVRVKYADAPVTSVTALAATVQEYWMQPDAGGADGGERQNWWARINFSNYQAFAITSYDSGRPGSTLANAGWALMPRILFPNKPIVNSGAELSDELNAGSSAWTQTAMTYFAEGYWNFGWWGVALVSFWAGFAFFVYTQFCTAMFQRGRVAGIAVGIFGMQMGYGVDGWFVSGMIGGFALALVYGLGILLLENAFSPAPKTAAAMTPNPGLQNRRRLYS